MIKGYYISMYPFCVKCADVHTDEQGYLWVTFVGTSLYDVPHSSKDNRMGDSLIEIEPITSDDIDDTDDILCVQCSAVIIERKNKYTL